MSEARRQRHVFCKSNATTTDVWLVGCRLRFLRCALAELGDPVDVESGERRTEMLALAQDREPRETGLEALEADLQAISDAWYALSLERGLAVREKLDPSLFVDCSQQELVDDPMAVVRRVYAHFGLEMDEAAQKAFIAHIEANPKGKHGRHEYKLEEYGLTRELIDKRFAFYTGDSRWPISQ